MFLKRLNFMNIIIEFFSFIAQYSDYFVIVCVFMSLITLAVYGADKRNAQAGKRRVSERLLIALAACFGGVGAFIGMRVFHHKTRKPKFRILVPIFMALQVLFFACIIFFAIKGTQQL